MILKVRNQIMKNKIKLPKKEQTLYWLKNIILLALPFIVMDVVLRVLGHKINYFRREMIAANILFNIIWILLIVLIALSLKGRAAKIFYTICFIIFFLVFLTNCIYYSLTGFFFSFHLILMASEGSNYILDTILNTSPIIYLICAVIIGYVVYLLIHFPKREKYNWKMSIGVIAGFLLLHIITPFLMGSANDSLAWDNWRNPRNVYNNFNDSNKCMKICGLYEYTARDLYVAFLKPSEKENPEDIKYLDEVYSQHTTHSENDYTGIFEGKNIIFLQLEGADSWLLDKDTMPNLYKLKEESISFDNHYSYYNGGGSTFNSELAVNTGLITPVSYVRNAYSFSSNSFKYSLANIMKEKGYQVNAFHMNTGEYYSRRINYLNWGYDNYYSLLDENNYDDLSYELDRELVLNKSFYDKLFKSDGLFMHYVITYTPHTPFSADSSLGKLITSEKYPDGNVPELSEEDCARLYAGETDYFIQLLMEALKDNGHYDDTVIVAYADHYLYTLNDKTILDKYKETDNNLINHTPFFIWSSDLKEKVGSSSVHIDKVNSQIDILPTVLNMFGIEYINENYIGSDIFDKSYTGFAFFSDYSWYDGNVYVENGEIIGGGKMNEEQLNEKNSFINSLIRKNDLTLKYDYFKRMDN
jgi:lipoteichoic acid synthase